VLNVAITAAACKRRNSVTDCSGRHAAACGNYVMLRQTDRWCITATRPLTNWRHARHHRTNQFWNTSALTILLLTLLLLLLLLLTWQKVWQCISTTGLLTNWQYSRHHRTNQFWNTVSTILLFTLLLRLLWQTYRLVMHHHYETTNELTTLEAQRNEQTTLKHIADIATTTLTLLSKTHTTNTTTQCWLLTKVPAQQRLLLLNTITVLAYLLTNATTTHTTTIRVIIQALSMPMIMCSKYHCV